MVGVHVETLDQRPGARVGSGIEHAVGLAAAGLQPQYVGIVDGPDDDRSARGAFQQPDTAQDQRPHDAFAEIGFLYHQVAQSLRRDDERLHRLSGLRVDQRGAGRQLRQFADETARTMGDDRFAPAEPAILGDVHSARQDDDQAWRHVAGRDHAFAGGIGAGLAETAHALDVRLGQRGEGLVATGAEDRVDGLRHGFERSAMTVQFEGGLFSA